MFHDNLLQTHSIRGIDVWKPKHIRQYNFAMGGMDLKAQVVQPHVMERKWAKKWTVKFVKAVAVHTMFVTRSSWNETYHLTCTLDLMITIILIHRPQVASPFGHGRPTIENPPDRLLGRNFSGKNLLTGGGGNRNPKMVGSWFIRKRKGESIYWCPDCQVRLCREGCSVVFHYQVDHSTYSDSWRHNLVLQ